MSWIRTRQGLNRSALWLGGGFLAGAAAGIAIAVAFKYALSAHVGLTPWLQALANAAIIVAALFTGWAAWIARSSFSSQRTTARAQLRLANDADVSNRHHASMALLWRFKATWESERMLGWRSALAEGLLVRTTPEDDLVPRGRLALGEIANFIDLAGYCVKEDLLRLDDAFNEFSYFWEVLWAASGHEVTPRSDDLAGLWEHAAWLIGQFAAREPDGIPPPLSAPELHDFLVGERDIARVEKAVLEGALGPPARRSVPQNRPPI